METARCKAFYAAATLGSLTAAADKLGYTPSGVSQLITALEDDLGFKLLERTRKGVRLTDEGAMMLPDVRMFLNSEYALYGLASDIKGLTVGSVNVASYPSVATYWLPEVIKKFGEDYPGIKINLLEGIRQEMKDWFDEGTADMGFLIYSEPMDRDWIPLAEDRMVAVLPKEHKYAGASHYPITECRDDDFIMPALGHDVDVENLLEEYNIVPKIKFTTMENPVMFAMIQSGLGMTITNELCTAIWADRLAIKPLDPETNVTFGIALPKDRHQSPAVKKFIEYSVKMLTKSEKSKK